MYPPNGDYLAGVLFNQAKLDESLKLKLGEVAAHPEDGYLHYELFQTYTVLGKYSEALSELEQTVKLFGYPELTAALHEAFTKSGFTPAMRLWAANLEQLERDKKVYAPAILAEVYSAVGDKDRAFY
jgi:hypothetical protein